MSDNSEVAVPSENPSPTESPKPLKPSNATAGAMLKRGIHAAWLKIKQGYAAIPDPIHVDFFVARPVAVALLGALFLFGAIWICWPASHSRHGTSALSSDPQSAKTFVEQLQGEWGSEIIADEIPVKALKFTDDRVQVQLVQPTKGAPDVFIPYQTDPAKRTVTFGPLKMKSSHGVSNDAKDIYSAKINGRMVSDGRLYLQVEGQSVVTVLLGGEGLRSQRYQEEQKAERRREQQPSGQQIEGAKESAQSHHKGNATTSGSLQTRQDGQSAAPPETINKSKPVTGSVDDFLEKMKELLRQPPNGGHWPTQMGYNEIAFHSTFGEPKSNTSYVGRLRSWRYMCSDGSVELRVDPGGGIVEVRGIDITRQHNVITEKLSRKELLAKFTAMSERKSPVLAYYDYASFIQNFGYPNTDSQSGGKEQWKRTWTYPCNDGLLILTLELSFKSNDMIGVYNKILITNIDEP